MLEKVQCPLMGSEELRGLGRIWSEWLVREGVKKNRLFLGNSPKQRTPNRGRREWGEMIARSLVLAGKVSVAVVILLQLLPFGD